MALNKKDKKKFQQTNKNKPQKVVKNFLMFKQRYKVFTKKKNKHNSWKKKKMKLQLFAQKRKLRIRRFRIIFENWLLFLHKTLRLVKLYKLLSNKRLRIKLILTKENVKRLKYLLFVKWVCLYKKWFRISDRSYGLLKTVVDGKKYREIKINSQRKWSEIIKLTAKFLSKNKNKKKVTKRRKLTVKKTMFKDFLLIRRIFFYEKSKRRWNNVFLYKKIKNFSCRRLFLLNSKKKKNNYVSRKGKLIYNCFFINPQQFLIGGAAELSNNKYTPLIYFCKNNIDVFRSNNIRSRLLSLHASFKWLYSSRQKVLFYKNIRFMFASITGAFAKLMRWAAFKINGLFSGNRWISGRLTAAIKIPYIPDCLFIPDIDENSLICVEAVKKNIAIMSLVGTDTKCIVDFPIFGNNKEFATIVKIIKLVLYIIKPKAISTVQHPKFFFKSPKDVTKIKMKIDIDKHLWKKKQTKVLVRKNSFREELNNIFEQKSAANLKKKESGVLESSNL